MKTLFSKRLLNIPVVLVFTVLLAISVMAETYTATTMRLLHYEGSVEIEDSSGKSSLVMENIRFNSGDSLHTGAASSASVGLDSAKIVTLDENTRVQFAQQSNAIKLSLTEGNFFLDVKEKLKDNETLDIQTSTMTVGIRGTIVSVSDYSMDEYRNRRLQASLTVGQDSIESAGQGSGQTDASISALEETIQQFPEAAADGRVSVLGVLEGTAQIQYQDLNGNNQAISIDAGKKATILDADGDGKTELEPVMDKLTSDDITDMIFNQINSDPELQKRIKRADVDIFSNPDQQKGDNWTIDSPVSIVAQSASKMFDGQPLTRTSDVLIQGLPRGYTCTASAGGSQTDAGKGSNPVNRYTIYDSNHQDVTSHFTNVHTQEGTLIVDPAPLTVWTGSASKVYDGTPLTSPESGLIFSPGYEKRTISGRNLSYVITEKAAASSSGQSVQFPETQTLYGICGTVLVHGSNPLTSEIKEFSLKVGEKLTVFLSDKDGENSIDYKVEPVPVEEIPEEILRIYQDNPELIEQACIDAGWDQIALRQLIDELDDPRSDRKIVEEFGLNIDSTSSEQLMQDFTNVRITIDTEGTNYNNRALNNEEAHYTPMKIDPSIKVTTTGSITDVGTVPNTYTLDWGSANPSNYILKEEIGTLEVTPAPATVTTGSAEKEFDGTPLTCDEASISGLVNGETASIKATGSITNVGSRSNTYTIDWGSAKEGNYSVSSQTGTLTVTENAGEITIKISVSGKVYDGKPLIIDTVVTGGSSENTLSAQSLAADSSASETPVTVEGLPSGFTLRAHITGSRTDAGTSELTIESYQILDEDGNDVTDQFSNVEIVESALTIDPAPATVTTGSASKEYDGTALTSSEASIFGLADADKDTVKVVAAGSITDVGSTENTYTIDWGTAKKGNYTLSESIGSLEVTPNTAEITFKAPSGSKTYDGEPLHADAAGTVTVTGLPEGLTFTASASGSQTDAGSSEATVDSYKILNADENDVTSSFANIKTAKGSLTVNPAAAAVTTGSASKEYDGKTLTSNEASISGLIDADKEKVTVTATGSITDVGTTENTYIIDWGEAKSSNYTLSESLGSLEVIANSTEITFKAASSSKTYDGTALTDETVSVDGELPADHLTVFEVTGSQTDVGSSDNTVSSYKILDASENDVTAYFSNIKTEKGTLTITPAAATITTGSASKAYDGKELTSAEASITGLTDADKAAVTVTATGTITKVGSAENTYTIDWGTAKEVNYTVSESKGTLEVTANNTEITFKSASSGKTYDGTALTDETVSVDGELPADHLTVFEVTGSQTDVGSSENTLSSYKILNASEEDVTEYFTNIKTENGTLTVSSAAVTITTESKSKEYDGTALTGTASISGLADADKDRVTVTATASITDVGSTESTYSIDWGTAKSSNYTVSESIGTLEVTKNNTEITFTSASAEKVYDGTPLIVTDVTVEGLPEGFTYVCSGGGPFGTSADAGTYENYFNDMEYSYTDENGVELVGWRYAVIKNSDGEDVTDNFSNIKFVRGTLTIKPLDVVFELNSYNTVFSGKKVLPDGMKGTYGNGSEVEEDYTNFETDVFGLRIHLTCGFNLLGEDKIQIDVDGYSDAGTYTYNPVETFTTGKETNYKITYEKKQFTIDPITVNLTVKDGSGVYDGNYHGAELTSASCGDETPMITKTSDTEWEIYGYTVFTSETITVKIEGGGTKAGEYPLTYSYTYGNNDPGNYNIVTPSIDKIVVEVLEITIDMKSPVFDYNGRTHGSGVPELKYENGPQKGESPTPSTMMSNDAGGFKGEYILSDGVTMTAQSSGKGPDAGSYTLSCTQEFSTGADKNNYKVNVTYNTLTINKITAVVTTGSADDSGGMYPVKNDEASITGLADTDIEYVTITATGEQKEKGSSANTYSIEWGTDDHPVNKENYIIEEYLGTLTMYNDVISEGFFGLSRKSRAGNLTETGSAAEKEAEEEETQKEAAETAAGSNGDTAASGQTGDDSKDAEVTDQSDQSSGNKEETGSKADQSDKDSEQYESTDSKADQSDKDAEHHESTDSKADQSDKASESKESGDSKADQGDQASESKEKAGKPSDSSEESKKDTASEESKKDSDSSKPAESEKKKTESNETEKTEVAESVKSESASTKKSDKAETKESDSSE